VPDCSNPIQCQTAKRPECTCACEGANHGALRRFLDSKDPVEREEGEQKFKELKEAQAEVQRQKRIGRRKRRAEARKVASEKVTVQAYGPLKRISNIEVDFGL